MKRSGREKKRLWKEAVAKRSGGGQTEAVVKRSGGGLAKSSGGDEKRSGGEQKRWRKEAVVNRSGGEKKKWDCAVRAHQRIIAERDVRRRRR